jgi:hypothetical protein
MVVVVKTCAKCTMISCSIRKTSERKCVNIGDCGYLHFLVCVRESGTEQRVKGLRAPTDHMYETYPATYYSRPQAE